MTELDTAELDTLDTAEPVGKPEALSLWLNTPLEDTEFVAVLRVPRVLDAFDAFGANDCCIKKLLLSIKMIKIVKLSVAKCR